MNKHIEECIKYFDRIFFSQLVVPIEGDNSDVKPIDATCWIAGGALRDYFSVGYPQSDIDVFFPNQDEFEKVKNCLLVKTQCEISFENEKICVFNIDKRRFELVKVFFPNPQATIQEFDFTVCCCAVDKVDVYMHEDFYADLAKRRLVINKLPFPLSTLQRLQKYIRKGYSICNGGLLDISKGIAGIDLTNPAVNTFEFYSDGSPRFVRFD
jgi:hypothetical protein